MIKENKKVVLMIIIGIVALTAVIFVKLTLAYLTDMETAENIITVGNVALKIEEGEFPDNSVIAAYQKLSKAPKIINTGSKDEFVFFKVAVPKANVTLLYETDTTIEGTKHNAGTKVDKTTGEQFELFKISASDANGTVTSITDDNKPKKVIFDYHSGDSSANNERAGWIYLDTKEPKSDDNYDYYYFGYNKKLIAGKDTETNQTVTLFDEIQLKSFIDEELGDSSNVQVDVTAYGIQSDELGYSAEYLDENSLNEIWDILERKRVTVNADT